MTNPLSLNDLFQHLREREPSPAPWLDGGPVAIYGAGSFGRSIALALLDLNTPLTCMVDLSAKPGQIFQGIPVLHPDTIQESVWASLTVVIGLHNPGSPVPDVIANLRSRGCAKVLSPIEALRYLGPGFGNRYWLVGPDYYKDMEPLLASARNTLVPESRPLFDAVVACRITGSYCHLPPPTHGINDFAPVEIERLLGPVRLVDGGAYDGDTIRALLQSGHRLQAIAAFEPDPANFSKLAAWVRNQSDFESSLWPCGLYSHAAQLQFEAGQGEASALSLNGGTTIQCVALDEAIPNFRPTFIKLDVEGAEPAALLGARHTIQAHRPFISAGLYHHPAHIWQVPLLIKELYSGYRLHLRLHAANGFELRLYAVSPSEGA